VVSVILIGIGSNLGGAAFGTPRAACEAALTALSGQGVRILSRSPWFETAPVPLSDQPWFVNGVAAVETDLDAPGLLGLLHDVETAFGRVRRARNEARVIDLDMLDYRGGIRAADPVLPHPRMTDRAFVLLPLRAVVPTWRHPVTGQGIDDLVAALPPGQMIRPLPADH